MEPPDRTDLRTLLAVCARNQRTVPRAVAVQIAISVLGELEVENHIADGAWRRAVHGGICPSSVLLTGDGGLVLGPSAIGRGADVNVMIERMRYAAPEVIAGSGESRRGDIYSLGAVLFELVTSEPLLRCESPDELARGAQTLVPGEVLDAHRGSLGELAPILERTLARNPADRFETADVLLEELLSLQRRERVADAAAQVAAFVVEVRALQRPEDEIRPLTPPAAASDLLEGPLEAEPSLPGAELAAAAEDSDVPEAPWEPTGVGALQPHGGEDSEDLGTEDDEPSWRERLPSVDDFVHEPSPWEPHEPSPWEPDEPSLATPSADTIRPTGQDRSDEPPRVAGGAFLFADGRLRGPASLLEMERHLSRTRDPVALVAFEPGRWRPLSESAAMSRRPAEVERRSFGLLELGPLLLELAAREGLWRMTLWSDEHAAMLEVGDGCVWRSAATSARPVLHEFIERQGLLPAQSIPAVEEPGPGRDPELLRRLYRRRLLNAGQVSRLRRQLLRRSASAPFTWPGGDYLLHPVAPRRRADALDIEEVVAYAVRHSRDHGVVEGIFHAEQDRDVVVIEDVRARLASLPLRPGEARYVAELPDRLPLVEALAMCWEEGREGSYRQLFLCIELGILRLE